MTRTELLPGVSRATPAGRTRPKLVLRAQRPLTRRELEIAWARIKARVLEGGKAFGVFVVKRGKSRTIRCVSINHHDYAAQMRVDRALKHWIGTYDGKADLGDIWEDLTNFDQPQGEKK